MKVLSQAVAIAALGLLFTGATADTSYQTISVVIDDQPVDFAGTNPQEKDGSVLVPLRGVFERLGAHVHYNPDSRKITAENGSTDISLSVGSSTAYVNNQPKQLSEPAESIDGTTLVPLRFVAEALGAYVEWHPDTSIVSIKSGNRNSVSTVPESDIHQDTNVSGITGKIANINTASSPEVITVRTDSGPVQVNLTPRTDVFQLRRDGSENESSRDNLHTGQVVTVQMRDDGDARKIEIKPIDQNASILHGRIVSVDNVDNPTMITLDTDEGHRQVNINPDTVINKGRAGEHEVLATSSALQVGQHVSARIRPDGDAVAIHIDVDPDH